MKYQALFSLKDKSKKLICRLLQFLFGALKMALQIFKHRDSLNLKIGSGTCAI